MGLGKWNKKFDMEVYSNSNYFLKSRLSKTTYNFNVDFAVNFNPGEADTTEIINLDDGEQTDLSLYLDNKVEDFDFNQELKYILNDDLNFDLGWQIKNLNLEYTETFAGQQVTNIASKPKTYSSFININWGPNPLLKTIWGLRISKFNGYDKLLINPKMSFKYNPISDLAIKASGALLSVFIYHKSRRRIIKNC